MGNYNNRVFGCALIKAINSNYNADFSGQPRTLPNGIVYSSDKVLKYSIKNYMKDVFIDEYIFGFKRLNNEFIPYDLPQAYHVHFNSEVKDDSLPRIARNLLSCIDLRLFGLTFAPKGKGIKGKNISLHGPVQINSGVNIWKDNNIYTEQIMSPFRNPSDDKGEDKQATTLGRQSRLEEGHYLHHFSINPQNLKDIIELAEDGCSDLLLSDITKLKEAMQRGVTWYDSASKAGCENEMLVWVELKEGSKKVLPNFTSLIDLKENKEHGKYVYDFADLKNLLENIDDDIESIEIYYNKQSVTLKNLPQGTIEKEI